MTSTRTIDLAEMGWVPDTLVRRGIRHLLRRRLEEQAARSVADRAEWLATLRRSPIALRPDLANAQHYEVPSAFFERVLGPHRKYSCAWWESGERDLGRAEAAMLERTCRRASLSDGASILDLGCGWGSLSLWVAQHYPSSRVLAVSNSKTQRETIARDAHRRGLDNLEVVTADINDFDPGERFDRIVSIEMFEHLRNWEQLLRRLQDWLAPEGRVFLHYFCHRDFAYPYEDRGGSDWMARHFFSGGMMPSEGLICVLNGPFEVDASWSVSGVHYQQTSEAWLRNLDREAPYLQRVLADCYGDDARRWLGRWRLFFLGCAELFGFRGGSEWRVAHVRLAAGERP